MGGGTGSLLLAVLRQYPALKGTLFELPRACAMARQRLSQEPERTRIEIVQGTLERRAGTKNMKSERV